MTEEQLKVLIEALRPAFDVDWAGETLVVRPRGSTGSPPFRLHVSSFDSGGQSTQTPSCGLTLRERDVMVFVAQGATNAEVARELSIAAVTVRKHLENIFGKLAVGTRTAAVAALRDRDSVEPLAVG